MPHDKDNVITVKKTHPCLEKIPDGGKKNPAVIIDKVIQTLPPVSTHHARTLDPIEVKPHGHEIKSPKLLIEAVESKELAPRKLNPLLEPIQSSVKSKSDDEPVEHGPQYLPEKAQTQPQTRISLQPVRIPVALNTTKHGDSYCDKPQSPLLRPLGENASSPAKTIAPPIASESYTINDSTGTCGAAEPSVDLASVSEAQNGNVQILYEMYVEEFPIVNGALSAHTIDELYCLSDVMPNCRLRLSTQAPEKLREMIGLGADAVYIPEDPKGTFIGLEVNGTYYCYVEQDSLQLEREKGLRSLVGGQITVRTEQNEFSKNMERDDGRGFDTCSCIYGTPCLDEYGCRNWRNRFDISRENGWAGCVSEE